MSFSESIRTCFSKYAVFEGRARRSEYWWFQLFCLLVSTAAGLVPVLGALVALALILPQLSAQVRRLHDGDRSGWFILLPSPTGILAVGAGIAAFSGSSRLLGILSALFGLASLAAWIILLVWYCQRGTIGSNRYGPDPYDAATQSGAAPLPTPTH
jgi:uncharacterized membrane protein YhaH (DUF805 family)